MAEVSEWKGSSPHTRGAQRLTYAPTGAYRIIPAYAGSTDPNRSFGEKMADHPRIRGEHVRGVNLLIVSDGSSPHTRGARRARECS